MPELKSNFQNMEARLIVLPTKEQDPRFIDPYKWESKLAEIKRAWAYRNMTLDQFNNGTDHTET